jgi:hypothetical protein
LRLRPGSSCIDKGINAAVPSGTTSDLDGHPRIGDGDGDGTATVDMGAYEWGRVYNITRNYSYLSIQPAIDDANDGDELLVTDGTYRGADNKNLDFRGKRLTLRSATRAENCIIDCENDGRGFYVRSGEGPDSLIENFTIINAGPANTFHGGGICFTGSSPTVRNCIIKSCSVPRRGGGIYCADSNSLFENCTVLDCNSSSSGGGICCENGSNPTFVNCLIALNYCPWDGGGMLCFDRASATIVNSTFTGNRSFHYGGGISSYMTSHPILVNCIIWANDSQQIYAEEGIDITFSDVQGGWSGAGNIDADPCFVDANNPDPNLSNYRLNPDSPCIDAGDNNSVPADTADLDGDGNTVEPIPFDLDGNPRVWDDDGDGNSVVDMGAYEFGWPNLIRNTRSHRWYVCIQMAIDDSKDGDEIEVAPWTYNEAIDFKGKSVRLYSSGGPEVTIIDANGIEGAYHVVQCRNAEDVNTILEGFTITGGNANGSFPDDCGGGMLNDASSPTVINCKFSGNTAYFGGGMLNDASSPTVTNCTFSGNSADHYGGGMYNITNSSPTVTNCMFSGNSAGLYGGGMYNITNSSPTVTNCMFSGNSAGLYGGGMYNITNSQPHIMVAGYTTTTPAARP